MKKSWRYSRILIGVAFFMAVLSACSSYPQRIWLNAPGWSRAELIGITRVGDPAPIAFDDEGQIYILMFTSTNDVSHPRLIALDENANRNWDQFYEEIESEATRAPRILWDGDSLQLFWISADKLYNTQVNKLGDLSGPARLVSGEIKVDSYDVAYNPNSGLAVWFAGPKDEPGLYTASPGNSSIGTDLIDAEGIWPDLVYDDSGTLHALWAHYPPGSGGKPFFYAAYPGGTFTPGQETRIVSPRIVGTAVLRQPQLGLDRENVYLFWGLTLYSGLEAGTSKAFYVSFPKGHPSTFQRPRQWAVPYTYKLDYTFAPASDLIASERVPLDPAYLGGSWYITSFEAHNGDAQEAVVTYQAMLEYLMQKSRAQIGATFFQGGEPNSYQLLSFSATNSDHPAIFSDEQGYLYLTWLEKGDLPGWGIYFASTADGIRQAFKRLTSDDAGRLAAETLFGLLSGALLIPIGFAWSVPALLALLLTTRLRGSVEQINNARSIVGFIPAFVVYFVVKLGFLPGMLDYTPFTAWIPLIPDWFHLPLRIATPVVIAAIAIYLAVRFIKRSSEPSVYIFLIIFSIVDSLLTMAVYGVLIYAAF